MEVMLLIAVLACGPKGDPNAAPVAPEIVAEVRANLQTGSLIFSQGDCLAVKVFSQSHYTHVGGVVVNGQEVTVFDSMSGVGVRKSSLEDYLRWQTPCDIRVVHPSIALTPDQATAFEQHLQAQVGRGYAISHHLTGQRAEGLHCSEYMTDALMAAHVIHASQPSRVSPGSLMQGLEQGHLCTTGVCMTLKAAETPVPENLNWCQRAWHSTTRCCSRCGNQVQRWFLCR